jgi:SRSO17 transposase
MTEHEELEQRFQQYTQGIVSKLGHVDREEPASLYLKGLVLPGERKSVEPMAARVDGRAVDKTRQRMGHVAANSPWEDGPILQFVRVWILSATLLGGLSLFKIAFRVVAEPFLPPVMGTVRVPIMTHAHGA